MHFPTFWQISQMVKWGASVLVRVPISGGVQAETGSPPFSRDVEENQAAFVD